MMRALIGAFMRAVTPLGVAGILAACGGGNSPAPSAPPPPAVSGTAATGAPMAGATVTVKGANDQTVTATTDAGGSFRANVGSVTFPAMIRVQAAGGATLYAWAFGAGTANLTPFTTIALITNPAIPDGLDAVFANWPANAAALNRAGMLSAQAVVNANFQNQMNAAGINFQTYDFHGIAFTANGTGIDGVLDALDFVFDHTSGTFATTLNGTATPVPFDPNISTTGINIGGTGGGTGGGSGSADITFTASTPSSGNGKMSVSGVSKTLDGLLTRITVTGTVGGLNAEVKVYFTTATGNITNITYAWGSTLNDNVVFSPSTIPAFEAVHTSSTKTINIDTDLTNADGVIVTVPTKLAHISATIVYP